MRSFVVDDQRAEFAIKDGLCEDSEACNAPARGNVRPRKRELLPLENYLGRVVGVVLVGIADLSGDRTVYERPVSRRRAPGPIWTVVKHPPHATVERDQDQSPQPLRAGVYNRVSKTARVLKIQELPRPGGELSGCDFIQHFGTIYARQFAANFRPLSVIAELPA